MNEWMVFKGTRTHKSHLVPLDNTKTWPFVIVDEQWQSIIILGGRKKDGELGQKRTKGYFRCRGSIDRSTHPPFFIRRAGCHASLEFPGSCQLILHTIRCAPCGVQYHDDRYVKMVIKTDLIPTVSNGNNGITHNWDTLIVSARSKLEKTT